MSINLALFNTPFHGPPQFFPFFNSINIFTYLHIDGFKSHCGGQFPGGPVVQFSSVAQSCLTLCHPMNRSMPGLPVIHQLPVLWLGLSNFSAKGPGSIYGQGTKIPQAEEQRKKKLLWRMRQWAPLSKVLQWTLLPFKQNLASQLPPVTK